MTIKSSYPKAWLSAWILMVTLLGLSSVTFAEKSKENPDNIKRIERKIAQNKRVLKKKNQERRKVKKDLGSLTRQLRYAEVKLDRTRRNLDWTKIKVRRANSKLRNAEKALKSKEKHLGARLREVYMQRDFGTLSLLFFPEEAVTAMDANYFFNRILKQDVSLVSTYREQKRRLKDYDDKLRRDVVKMARMKSRVEQQEVALQYKKRQKSRAMNKLNVEISKIQKQTAELERSSKQMTQFIKSVAKNAKQSFLGTGKFLKPVKGWLSSRFGYRRHPISKRRIHHAGIDLAAPRGYRIKASDSGVVIVAGRKKKYRGYGKVTVIDHGRRKKDGKRVSTVYAHQSRILVKKGDFVKKGEEIGWVGSTGYSTGPHLHFEIRVDGVPVNPQKYVRL